MRPFFFFVQTMLVGVNTGCAGAMGPTHLPMRMLHHLSILEHHRGLLSIFLRVVERNSKDVAEHRVPLKSCVPYEMRCRTPRDAVNSSMGSCMNTTLVS